jgi:DNA topoisomerase-3
MGKALVIAEKPSVAADLARVLRAKKVGDHYENERYVITSALGHLLEIDAPEEFQPRRGKWTFAALPVIPPRFELKPREKGAERLKAIERLIQRPDITEIINACDAGREGELIFRYLIQYTGARQPIRRLWLQSMTPEAIRAGFEHLRSDAEMRGLADAAVCRSEADWLVGINGTRALTAFNSKSGGFVKTTVGRVQTPTLAILVEREDRIRKFVPRDYWELHATFEAEAGAYTGRWFDEQFKRDAGRDADPDLRPERLWDRARAEAIQAKCLGRPGVVTEESKPATQPPPLLFDLTSLQREANARFGFSAQTTLALAQALYEKHKVLTYPRTDSRHLPEDYPATVRATLEALRDPDYQPFAAQILEQGWVRPGNKRVFDNAKVSDHFAIIPTAEPPRHLNDAERKLYDFVVRRFLAAFFPPAEFLVTTRITRVEGEPFKTEGKVLVKPGWLVVYGREAQDPDSPALTPVRPGETVATRDIELRQQQTKPPPRYTEATLLSAMEGAGRLVEDDELRAAMAEKGLGTPATRAAIIEGLLQEHYLVRQGKELQPTAKAFSLLTLLRGLGIEELTKPELTGDWEYRLKQMEHGRLRREEFMRGIAEMTRHIVERAKSYEHDTVPGDFGVLRVPCPKCGGEIHEKYKTFQCAKCDWSLYKIILGRQFEPEEVETLLREGRVGPLQGFRSKQGRPFNAMMKLGPAPDFKVEFDFGNGGGETASGDGTAPAAEAAPDFSGQQPLGKCPQCGGGVFDAGMNYVCEKAVGARPACRFKVGKVILQRALEPAQLGKLLAEGKTDLLKDFVSRRTGRKFEAFLVLKDGKVEFEFAPREKKPRATSRTRAAAPQPPPAPVDFTGQEPVGPCPRCGGRVFETESDYRCEHTQRERRPCKFRTGKVILEQPVTREQMAKLLTERRTDKLEHFVSRKTGRQFAAFLVLDEQGKVGFEFPER